MTDEQFEILDETIRNNFQYQNEILLNMHYTIKWICTWLFFISIFFIGQLVLILMNIGAFIALIERIMDYF